MGSKQPLLGKWKTKDDETGRIKSIVEITERDGMYYGEVVELFGFLMRTKTRIATSVRTTAKTNASWAWRLSGHEGQKDLEWGKGTICDPKKGSVYDAKCGSKRTTSTP